jgi:hypothetical protein
MPEGFEQWAQRHAEIFGMTSEAELKSILAWRDLFDAAGYRSDELEAATRYLALRPAELAAGDERFGGKMLMHLAAVQRRIIDCRALIYRADVAEIEQTRGTCTLCSGSGRVIVPHRLAIEFGEWMPIKVARGGLGATYYQAVLCTCPLGRWVGAHITKDEHRPSRLEDYEKENPAWRWQLET